jgi:Fe-S-cluster containining protein
MVQEFFLSDLDPALIWTGILNRLKAKGILDEEDIQSILVGSTHRKKAPESEPAAHSQPKLRSGLTISLPEEEDQIVLEDPVAWKRLRFERRCFPIFMNLDGKTSLDEIHKDLDAAGIDLSPDKLKSFIRRIDALDLLENDETATKLARLIQTEEAVPVRPGFMRIIEKPDLTDKAIKVLPDARFQCRACGECCMYDFPLGPVTDAEQATILRADWSKEYPPKTTFFDPGIRYAENQELTRFAHFKKVNGHCIFLAPDNKCRVHQKIGYEKKPFCCKKWPLAFFMTDDALYAFTRYRCFHHHHYKTGRPLRELVERSLDLVPVMGVAGAPEEIPLTEDIRVPLGDYLVLEERLLAILAEEGSFEESILKAWYLYYGLLDRLSGQEGEVKAGTPDFLEKEGDRAFIGKRRKPKGPLSPAVSGILKAFYQHFYRWLIYNKGDFPAAQKFLLFLYRLIKSMTEIPGDEILDSILDIEPGTPLQEVRFDAAHPDIRAIFSYYLRNFIFGKQTFTFPAVRKGLGVLFFLVFFMKWHSRHLAVEENLAEVTVEHVAESMEYIDTLRDRSIFNIYLCWNPRISEFIMKRDSVRQLFQG